MAGSCTIRPLALYSRTQPLGQPVVLDHRKGEADADRDVEPRRGEPAESSAGRSSRLMSGRARPTANSLPARMPKHILSSRARLWWLVVIAQPSSRAHVNEPKREHRRLAPRARPAEPGGLRHRAARPVHHVRPTFSRPIRAAGWTIIPQAGLVLRDPVVRWGLQNVGQHALERPERDRQPRCSEQAKDFGLMNGAAVAVVHRGVAAIGSFARADRDYTRRGDGGAGELARRLHATRRSATSG